MSPHPVLLLIRPTGLGDLLMGIPAWRALRRAFPEHEFVTTCPASLVPLARRVGVVDRFVTETGTEPGTAVLAATGAVHSVRDHGGALDPSLHRQVNPSILDATFAEHTAPDVVVVLKMPEDEINRRVLARHPRIHLAYRHPLVAGTRSFPVYDEEDHVLARWERLLAPAGIHPDRADLVLDIGLEPRPEDVGDTVIHLGSGSPSRRWPLDRWAAVARELAARGQRVVFSGSPAERPLVAEAIALSGLDSAADASGTTSVLDLARLIAGAGLVIGVDSGIPHLATVLARRAVTLFGPTPPQWWGPPPGDPRHRVLWTGRLGMPYGTEPDPGLLEITATDVVRAAATFSP